MSRPTRRGAAADDEPLRSSRHTGILLVAVLLSLCLGFFLAWLWRRLSNGKPPAIRDATVEERGGAQPGPAK